MHGRVGDCRADAINAAGVGVAELALVVCASWALPAMEAAVPCVDNSAVAGRVAVTGAAGRRSGRVPGGGCSGSVADNIHRS